MPCRRYDIKWSLHLIYNKAKNKGNNKKVSIFFDQIVDQSLSITNNKNHSRHASFCEKDLNLVLGKSDLVTLLSLSTSVAGWLEACKPV